MYVCARGVEVEDEALPETKIVKISLENGDKTTVKLDESQLKFECGGMYLDKDGNVLLLPSPYSKVGTTIKNHPFLIKKILTKLKTNNMNQLTSPSEYTQFLLENPDTTDADIEFEVDGKIIKAHKCILKSQSAVFMKLFSI